MKDVPRAAFAFMRNRFLQSYAWMAPFIVLSAGLSSFYISTASTKTPPQYETFLAKLVGGDADDHTEVQRELSEIRGINPTLAAQFAAVISVFEERRKQNSGEFSAARANVLVRTLEANIDNSWRAHPLRKHGLAEAYVLAAQATESGNRETQEFAAKQYKKAIDLYEGIWNSSSPLVSKLQRSSALNNLGNIHLYRGRFDRAEEVYLRLVNDPDLKNTSSWGNLIAALVYQNRPQDAVAQGLAAKEWAETQGKAFNEPFTYTSILENTAQAFWQLKQYDEAHTLLEAATAFRDDNLNRSNLAVSYAILGDFPEAELQMRRVREPATLEHAKSTVLEGKNNVCDFVIWAAIIPNDEIALRAANFAVFLDQPISEENQKLITQEKHDQMAIQAAEKLGAVQEACTSFTKISGFLNLVLSNLAEN